MTDMLRGRVVTAMISFCLLVPTSVEPASANIQPVDIANDGTGICANCKPNTPTKTGNAVSGSVTDNGNGSANASMVYAVPNDGDTYSGTSQVIVKDGAGNTILNVTGTVYDPGTGGLNSTGLNGIYVPVGGTVYINVIETNATNTRGFSGSYHLQNYQPAP